VGRGGVGVVGVGWQGWDRRGAATALSEGCTGPWQVGSTYFVMERRCNCACVVAWGQEGGLALVWVAAPTVVVSCLTPGGGLAGVAKGAVICHGICGPGIRAMHASAGGV
jgi:hypothetical protein